MPALLSPFAATAAPSSLTGNYNALAASASVVSHLGRRPGGPSRRDIAYTHLPRDRDGVGFLYSNGHPWDGHLLATSGSRRGQGAITVPNMLRAVPLMERLQGMRAHDPHFRSPGLNVGWTELAVAMAQTDAASRDARRNIYRHNHRYDWLNVGENLSWGERDGGLDWCYRRERGWWERSRSPFKWRAYTFSVRDPKGYEQVGHYLNITDPRFHVFAMGFDSNWTAASEFGFGGASVPMWRYRQLLSSYARRWYGTDNPGRIEANLRAAQGRINRAREAQRNWDARRRNALADRTRAYNRYTADARAAGPAAIEEANVNLKRLGLPQITKFADVAPAAWYAPAALAADNAGLMHGNGVWFRPTNRVTRAEWAVTLWRASGSPAADPVSYRDAARVPSWARTAVGWTAAHKVMSGYGDGRFGPNDGLTRSQAAATLLRARGQQASLASSMRWAVSQGLIRGWPDRRGLDPDGSVSRAQAAQILVRAKGKNLI